MKVVNLRKEKYTHYIGRGSIFGNPFKIGKDGTREEVIQKYEKWVIKQPKILQAIYDLPSDAILGCYCVNNSINFIRPIKRCHGEILLEIYKRRYND